MVNADDYYGPGAFTLMYEALEKLPETGRGCMVAYKLRNTVSDFGTVTRGVCRIDGGEMTAVKETFKIGKAPDGSIRSFADSEEGVALDGESPVSMNFWGFKQTMMQELKEHFPAWLDENLPVNPLKCEYFLPFVANALIKEGRGTIRVLPCHETWHGITYKEDMPSVVGSIAAMRKAGIYPEKLWE